MNAAPQELLKEYVKDLIEWIYQTSLVCEWEQSANFDGWRAVLIFC